MSSRNKPSKKTVGSIASELQMKTPDSNDPIEIQRATESEYLENLKWCVLHALKKVDCSHIKGHDECKKRDALSGDFFISALLKREKVLSNVLRNFFIPTKDCPTPNNDQTVYRYNHLTEDVEFLWTVPDEETCEIFRQNKSIIVPSERGLLQFVLWFYDGTLFNTAKKLNGETIYAGGALAKERSLII